MAAALKAPESDLAERVEKLLEERKAAQREIEKLRGAQRGDLAGEWVGSARDLSAGDGKALAVRVEDIDAKELRTLSDDLRDKLGDGVVMIVSESGGKVLLAVGVTRALTARLKAGDLVRETARIVGGGGGGRPDFAQAGGKDASKIDEAIDTFYELVGAAS
jgi:alanyl-tRNA synthetase